MKKLTSLLLSILMILGIFAGCGEGTAETTAPTTEPEVAHTLSVGFGRADVTPTEPTPLGGLGDTLNRFHTGVKDNLYLSCTAFTDETGTTMLLFSLDVRSVSDAMLMGAAKVARKTGVPAANIIVATNHSHSAPDPYTNHYSIENYNKLLQEKMLETAEAALADRKPATMSLNTVNPEGYCFIRHYELSDGTYAGDNFGKFSGKTIVGHTREADNALQLVKFTREDAKDIILMNWQGHPTGHSGDDRDKILSFSGSIIAEVEKGLDCYAVYVLGASGNVNNSSRISSENAYSTYKEKAAGLAKYIIDAESSYQEAALGKIQIAETKIACASKSGGTVDIPIDAYAIGDFALAAAPYEMYCENGLAIKEASGFKTTFISTCTNGRSGNYIPSEFAYTYNNKPDVVYGISQTAYAQGSAELLQEGFVSLLKQLQEAK